MRLIISLLTACIFMIPGAGMAMDYSGVYESVEQTTLHYFDEHTKSITNLYPWIFLGGRPIGDTEFFNETDTSFRIKRKILGSYTGTLKSDTPKASDYIYATYIEFSSDVKCLVTNFYEWECLYKSYNIIVEDKIKEKYPDDLYNQEFLTTFLETIENEISEVY